MSRLMREHVFACYGFPMECTLSVIPTFHVLISSHYGVFIFLQGVGAKPVGTLLIHASPGPPCLAPRFELVTHVLEVGRGGVFLTTSRIQGIVNQKMKVL